MFETVGEQQSLISNHELASPVDDPEQSAHAEPWRPVQYLGSKLRALDCIIEAVDELLPGGGTVWDPFAGSTVVSQALAAANFRVVAGDALSSCAVFATAMLGVGRREQDSPDRLLAMAAEIVTKVRVALEGSPESVLWKTWLDREAAALADGDGRRLLDVHAELPQRWRGNNAHEPLGSYLVAVGESAHNGDGQPSGFLSTAYAGSYFGLKQSLELEYVRSTLNSIFGREVVEDSWLHAALLTALCHAASAAVFSPGKHFAQPHRIRDGKNLEFHAKRALADRSVDVLEEFVTAAREIGARARRPDEGHRAAKMLVEGVSEQDLREWGVQLVYADPPYTAQQYSRFYHLLDTIVSGTPVTLQKVRGEVTRGLYPEGRYLSPYCSRVKAPDAIRDLAQKAADADAHLVFSYSGSRGETTGNARSVSLEALVGCVKGIYGERGVTVQQLSLRYRQFNHRSVEVSGRHDPEYLVIGRK